MSKSFNQFLAVGGINSIHNAFSLECRFNDIAQNMKRLSDRLDELALPHDVVSAVRVAQRELHKGAIEMHELIAGIFDGSAFNRHGDCLNDAAWRAPKEEVDHIDLDALAGHIDLVALSKHISVSEVAGEIDAEDIAQHIDHKLVGKYIKASDIASEIDVEDIAQHIDASDVADHIDLDMQSIKDDIINTLDMNDIASNIDVEDLARHIDTMQVAGEIDLSDLAAQINLDALAIDIARNMDCDDLAKEINIVALAGAIDLAKLAGALLKALSVTPHLTLKAGETKPAFIAD